MTFYMFSIPRLHEKSFAMGINRIYRIQFSDNFKFFLFLFVVYFISFGCRILHPGYYWDDYTLIGVDPHLIQTYLAKSGRFLFSFFHKYMNMLPSSLDVFLYKFISIVSEFLSILLFYIILDKMKFFSEEDNKIITLFFAVIPAYQARESLVISHYSLSLFLLFFSIYLIISRKSFFSGFIASLCLFISFEIEANILFFLFFAGVISYPYFLSKAKGISMLFKKERWIIPCFIIFAVKVFLRYSIWDTKDEFQDLNAITLSGENIIESLKVTKYFNFIAFPSLDQLFYHGIPFWFWIPLLFCLVVLYLYKFFDVTPVPLRRAFGGIGKGFMLIFISILPFCLVGKLPHNIEWASRYQYLTMAGGSISLYFIIQLFRFPKVIYCLYWFQFETLVKKI